MRVLPDGRVLSELRGADLPEELRGPPEEHLVAGLTDATRVIAAPGLYADVVDALFAAFMLIQGAYLFGGRDTLERTGMTFADYARRGFFELVTVACLALGFLWALALVARREQRAGFGRVVSSRAQIAKSNTSRLSTATTVEVISEGTPMTMRGRTRARRRCTWRMK